jgi:hypothetical protein
LAQTFFGGPRGGQGDGRERAWLCSVLFGKHLDDERAAGIEGWERSEAFIERNPEITMFIYYIFQLQLLCSLCYGRNSNVQKTLLDASKTMKLGIEFDELLAVVRPLFTEHPIQPSGGISWPIITLRKADSDLAY